MAYKSIFNDIIFIEGDEEYVQFIGPIEYKKDSFYNQQFKNLDNVKDQMSRKAHEKGANAIINFKYGQKTTSFWRSLFLSLDDNVNWYGSGSAVVLPMDRIEEIKNEIKNK